MSRATRKFVIFLLVVVAILLALHLTPAGEALRDLQALKSRIQQSGRWAPALYLVLGSVLTAIGCPRTLICAAGGMVFGFWKGLLLSTVGSVIGSYVTFLFARWSGREWVEHRLHHMQKLQFVRDNQNLVSVILIRQLPVANILGNLLLSLTRVTHFNFLVGSTIGFLPAGIIVVLSSASLLKDSPGLKAFQLAMAVVLLALMAGTVWHLRRKWTRHAAAEAAPSTTPDDIP